MKQTKTHIKIIEFIEKFSDDPILGATSMNGQLCVRPDFQREMQDLQLMEKLHMQE